MLSFFIPGLGHIYDGEIGMGLTLMFVGPLLIGVVVVLALLVTPWGWLLGLVAVPALWLYGMVDAYHTAEAINRGETDF